MKTIVFDFGNVVGFFDHFRTLRRLEPYTDLTAQQMFHRVYGSDLEDAFESNRIDESEFVRRFIDLCRLSCTPEFLIAACADIFTPNPEICGLIPRLRPRYQLLLGSNTNCIHSRLYRRQFAEVLRHFDALVLSHEIGVRKPQTAFFEHCQALADGRADECLLIDDVAANVEGARAIGWQGIVYQPNHGLSDRLAALGVIC
ncbi:MAG: HAD family phosphatase [Gemmataceae bacterium]|nr:HAD family phosphatase [Gemmataceae bacterium]